MRLARPFTAAVLLSLVSSFSLRAQNRDVRAERVYIDDNGTEGVTILAPHPMLSGASYSLTLPDSLPSTNFVLLGTPSGAMKAEDPSAAFNTVSWLLSGNSLSDPANNFLGTTDSADLAFRTNGVERLRINALGNVALGTASPKSARFHVGQTFDDPIPFDSTFMVPLAFGIRSEGTSPAVPDSQGVYISTGNLMFVKGANDLSVAASFIGNVGVVLNSNTGGGINEATGVLGFAVQADSNAQINGSISGLRGGAQITGGTANEVSGASADVNIYNATVARASGIATGIGVGGSGNVTDGYGVYVHSPYVDTGATMTNYTSLQIDNLYDSGQVAIRYNGSGSNVPFIVEGDGDVGIGTMYPEQARLHISRLFPDALTIDSLIGLPISFGVRTDVSNPFTATPGAVYVGSATFSSVSGGNDMSPAGQFVGNAALMTNTNTGGTLNGMIGMVGQVMQTDPAAGAHGLTGVLGQVQLLGGTVDDVSGLSGLINIGGNTTVASATPFVASMQIGSGSTVTNGYGLFLRHPSLDSGATLNNFTALEIENLTDSGQVAIRYNGSGSNVPFIVEGDGDVGIGTTSPGEARLRVSRTFGDSIAIDPFFGEPLTFGTRTDVTSPAVVDSAAVYISSGSIAFAEGGNDLSGSETFVGGAGLSVNTNSGGTVPALFGLVGQSLQRNSASASDFMLGTLGGVEVSGGTVNSAIGVLGQVEAKDGTISSVMGMISRLDLSGSAAVNSGLGLYISEPSVSGGATLTSFTGLQIGNLSGTGYTALRYDGSNPNESVIIEGDGDVGIGDNTPDAKLDVENNDAVVPTLALNNGQSDGIALQVANGGVVLSYGAGAPATIPTGVAVFSIDDELGGLPPVVGLPSTGTNGQILYIYIPDPEGATVGGNLYASGDRLTFIYAAGAWQLFHLN